MSQAHGSVAPTNIPLGNEQLLHEGAEHQLQAERLAGAVFTDSASPLQTVEVIWSFIRSYDQHRNELPLDQWLVRELGKYPHLWQGNAEAEQAARALIDSITRLNRHKESLQQHLDKGKSSANWLAKELEQDARDNPALNLTDYAAQVQDMLQAGNQALVDVIAPERNPAERSGMPLESKAAEAAKPHAIWDEGSRLTIAREVNDQALLNAALNAASHGARILGVRAWNWLRGVENAPASAALQEFFDSSLKSAQHVGAQVAVSGGVVVAARSGWLGIFLKDAPVEVIATTAYTGLERAKVLYKLGQGEILAETAVKTIEQTTMTAARALAQTAERKGAELGAKWGACLGAVFGPAGAAVGGVVGGTAGRLAGKVVGTLIEKGGRKIVETASKVIRKVTDTVTETVSSAWSSLKSNVSSLFS